MRDELKGLKKILLPSLIRLGVFLPYLQCNIIVLNTLKNENIFFFHPYPFYVETCIVLRCLVQNFGLLGYWVNAMMIMGHENVFLNIESVQDAYKPAGHFTCN